jgi:L-fucose mutarotase
MLKGLDPVLNADLLYVLRSMGHGDELVVADANFPALTMGRRMVPLDGVDGPRVLRAILSVMPLDDFTEAPCIRMQVVDDPDAEPEICRIYQGIIDEASGARIRLASLERSAFYERARAGFAVIRTGETRLYGNLIIIKGVIRPK